MNYSSDIVFSGRVYVRVGLEVESVTQELGETVTKINYQVEAQNVGHETIGMTAECLALEIEAVVGSFHASAYSGSFPERNKVIEERSSYDDNWLAGGGRTFHLPRSATETLTAQVNAYLTINSVKHSAKELVSVEVPQATFCANDAGTWKPVKEAYAKVNGTWQEVTAISAKSSGAWKSIT